MADTTVICNNFVFPDVLIQATPARHQARGGGEGGVHNYYRLLLMDASVYER